MSAVDIRNNNDADSNTSRKFSLGIRSTLLLGFSAVIFIFLIGIAITFVSISNAKKYSYEVMNSDIPMYDAALDLSNLIFQSQLVTQRLLISPQNTFYNEYSDIWSKIDNIQSSDNLLTFTNKDYMQKWEELKQLIAQLKVSQTKIIQLSNKDKSQAISVLFSESVPLMTKIGEQLNMLENNQQKKGLLDIISIRLHKGAQEVADTLTTAQNTEYAISLIGVIIAFLIAFLTARAITRHIRIFREHSSRIASGDLTQTIAVESFDEIGQLGNDLNKMTSGLAAITREITQSCHNMIATLEEVRHAVDMQSSGASEQASSINEITASLSEIEKSSAQTMEKAKSLGETAEQTQKKGQLGLEAVDQSVNGMKEVREKVQLIAQTILELSHKTQQVGEITSVVNNLAQQSKMLALNASIEAAKAGEFGKGFAVVAVEVKTLAEQSEQATLQVQGILEDIRRSAEKAVLVTEEGTKGVDTGTALVEQTGELIRNLTEVINDAMIATQQIESAVRQESAGIEQITAGMNEINQVTASFVASVKQTTEAMSHLTIISKNLQASVDTYKI